MCSAPAGAFNTVCTLTWKTFSDRFNNSLCEHRTIVNKTAVVLGIIEVLGELEMLLDDLMLEVEEWDEK